MNLTEAKKTLPSDTTSLGRRPRARHRRLPMALLILASALVIWIPRQQRLSEARETLRASTLERVELERRASAAKLALETARQELAAIEANSERTAAAVARAERQLDEAQPGSRWAEPPAVWPDWNPASPYVWIRKETIPHLPVEPFGSEGTLRPEVASVLGVNEAQQDALNRTLSRLMTEYHSIEASQAERTDKHLDGIVGDGPKVTVQIQPSADSQRFKDQFQAALTESLGEQRSQLLSQTAEFWMNSEFGIGAEPKTISVIRHPDGSYNISVRSGSNWMSVGGPSTLESYVPAHLMPLFSDVLPQPKDGAPAP